MTDDRERGPLDFDDDEAPAPAPAPPPAERSPLVGAAPAAAGQAPPRRPSAPRSSGYLWVVGAGAVLLVIMLFVATIKHGTERGARGVPNGETMPPFAVPLAAGRLDGDANIAKSGDEGQAGRRPACEVRGPEILNGCELREAGPVVLAFFVAGNRQCVRQLDTMQRVASRAPGVRFAAIAIRGDRDDLRTMVRRHRWSFPVGFDRDGALSSTYHVQVCPQLTFARRGGRVVETTFGELAPAELAARARRLSAASTS